MKRLLVTLIAALLLTPLSAVAGSADPSTAASKTAMRPLPFDGERLSFEIGWEFINAGTATMAFSDTDNGYRIDTDARTNKFFDVFKKVRDSILSEGIYLDGKPQSTVYDQSLNERKYHAKKRTDFLWQQNRVLFTQDGKKESYDVPAGHLNVMDAFYLTRTLPVIRGEQIKIPIFDSRKSYQIEVMLIGTEKVRAPWGEMVECLVIEPKLKSEGIFSSVGTMNIWVTNDPRRIPLKMTAKIKIGRIIARLTDYKAPTAL